MDELSEGLSIDLRGARSALAVPGAGPWADADHHLTPATREALVVAVPENTRRAYRNWWSQADQWCRANGRTTLPMTTETLTEWIHHLTRVVSERTGKPYAASSLDQAVAAVQSMHKIARHPRPDADDARTLIRAHSKRLADAGRTTKKSAIVTDDQALDVAERIDPNTLTGARDRLLCALSYAAWTRRSELAALNLSDAWTTSSPKGVVVRFRSSKTDQDGKGAELFLPATGDALCPHAALTAWRTILAERGVTDGRLLRKIDRWGNISAELHPGSVNDISKKLVGAAGHDTDERGRTFTSHGWRASGRSAARAAGASAQAADEHGRWKPGSKAGEGYERDRGGLGDNPMSKVAESRRSRARQLAAEQAAADTTRPVETTEDGFDVVNDRGPTARGGWVRTDSSPSS
ncbi:integrase [Kitasatospora sp. MAA19]|uniref:hypothetical protein n=1 Tax=unclassified Kitasatospora TaxID=2633591 RepID=UPI00247501B3|nr:hypothetical protein [Kitasatospora sp. MAA19]MDH6711330.1 integrase [Kitasatospora sp. MAA19]